MHEATPQAGDDVCLVRYVVLEGQTSTLITDLNAVTAILIIFKKNTDR